MRSTIDVAELLYDALTRRRQPRLVTIVAEHLNDLPTGARVLDLGSGSGQIAVEVERATGVRVTTCDIDLVAVREGVSALGGVVVGDGQALPFAPGSFTATYLVYVLHHVPDQGRLLAEVRHALRDGGRVILVEFDRTSALVVLFRLLARLTGRRCQFHTPDSLEARLRTMGFDTEVRRLDRATFVTVAERSPNPHGLLQHLARQSPGQIPDPDL